MEIYIIHSLLGDYSKVAETIEKELGNAATPCPAPGKGLLKKNTELREENKLLREQLNGLYLKYGRMAAAFGEISYYLAEAAAVQSLLFKEE